MSNEDQIEELKRLIEEERKQHSAKLHARYLRRKASAQYVKDLAYSKSHKRKPHVRAHTYKIDAARKLAKQEKLAGRPRPNTCEICSNVGRIVWDHCHNSNKFRGWLCDKCNSILGYVNDDPVLLEKLAVYLRTHNGS